MAAGLDKISEALKKHKADVLLTVAALATAENKWKAIGGAVKDMAVLKLVGYTGLLAGAFMGVKNVVKDIVRESGALEAAVRRMSQMRAMQATFEPLLRGAARARERIAELIKFTQSNPIFPRQSVADASRALEILSRGALGARDSLELAGRGAKASGEDISKLGSILGTLHRELQDGKPISGTVGELEMMGLVSSAAADRILKLQQSGEGVTAVFGAVRQEIEANSKSTEDFGDSIEGLQMKLEDTRETMLAAFGQPFLDGEKAGMQSAIKVANNLTPAMETLGKTFAKVVDVGSGFGNWIKELITGIPGLSTVVGGAAKAFVVLATAVTAVGLARAATGILSAAKAIGVWVAAAQSGAAAASLLTKQTNLLAAAQKAEAAGSTVSAVALRSQAAACGAAATGTGLFARATAGAATGLRALGVAMIANPWTLIITAATTAAAALWQWAEASENAWKAQMELKQVHVEQLSALESQIAAIRTLDDLNQALAASTTQLAEAQDALNKARAEGKDSTEIAQREEQVRQLKKIGKSLPTGEGLSGGAEERAHLQEKAAIELRLAENARQNAIGRAGVAERPALLQGELDKARSDISEAELFRSESERIKRGSGGDETSARMMRSASSSKLIQESEDIRMRESYGIISPKQADAARAGLAARVDDVQKNYGSNHEKAAQLEMEIKQSQKAAESAGVELEAEQKMAALRSEGLSRAREESKIRLDTLEKQKALASGSLEKQAIEARIAAEKQSLDLVEKQGQRQREADAEHLKVLELQRQAARLALQGNFVQADATNKRALKAGDAAENKRLFTELKSQGYDDAGARTAVAANYQDRLAARQLEADQFRTGKNREISRAQLDADTSEGGRIRRLQADDRERAQGTIKSALAAGVSAEDAVALAKREGLAQIGADKAAGLRSGNVVADSLQAIGGGGGVSSGANPLLEAQKRSNALQEDMKSILERMEKNGGGMAP